MKDETTSLFQFEVDVIEKGSTDSDKSHRIGGYASTSRLDRQGEEVLEKALDFSEFLKSGWFNDNHSKTSTDILGYPYSVQLYPGKGWWVEGYLIKGYPPSERLWTLAKALQTTPRRLAFSVEGAVIRRDPNKESRILKAKVSHVAITHVPINPDCILEVLSKSICRHASEAACMHCDKDCMMKSLDAGTAKGPGAAGGSALRTEDIDGLKNQKETEQETDLKKKRAKGGDVEFIKSFFSRRGVSEKTADRFIQVIKDPKVQKLIQEVRQ